MSNYPDDINDHGSDYRSPFSDDSLQLYAERLSEDLAINHTFMANFIADNENIYMDVIKAMCNMYENRSSFKPYTKEFQKFLSLWADISDSATKHYGKHWADGLK